MRAKGEDINPNPIATEHGRMRLTFAAKYRNKGAVNMGWELGFQSRPGGWEAHVTERYSSWLPGPGRGK